MSWVKPTTLVRQVADTADLKAGRKQRRVQLYTVDGRIYQHSHTFAAGSTALSVFVRRVSRYLCDHGYALSSLDMQYWSDVTDQITQQSLNLLDA